jgi:hypothetical protein
MPAGAIDTLTDPSLFDYDQDTVFDRLNEVGVAWRIYHGDIPQSLVLNLKQALPERLLADA